MDTTECRRAGAPPPGFYVGRRRSEAPRNRGADYRASTPPTSAAARSWSRSRGAALWGWEGVSRDAMLVKYRKAEIAPRS
jgi:hypothetical protein